MPEPASRSFLPVLLGSLHQQRAEGELALEQNDGLRKLYWAGGDLVYLHSDAVGEQFGSYLIRRGVLDAKALKALLTDGDHTRVGERVVQCGLMTVEERDGHLQDLFGSVLLHAMEHPILHMSWRPGPLGQHLSEDLQFWLNHRHLVWDTFHSVSIDQAFVDQLRGEPGWRWAAKADLLEDLRDFPLTPSLAYALTMLGTEALGYGTIEGVTSLGPSETARMVATLWGLGGLRLVEGTLPLLPNRDLSVPAVPKPLPPEPAPEIEPDLEISITLVDDDPVEPTIEVDPPDSPRSMNLMDVLELEAQAPPCGFPSPAGPAPTSSMNGAPFHVAIPGAPEESARLHLAQPTPIQARAPSAPAEPAPRLRAVFPQAQREVFSLDPEPAPLPPPPQSAAPYPSHALPLSVQEEDLPPLERLAHLVAKANAYQSESQTTEATRTLGQAIQLANTLPGSYEALLLLGKLGPTHPTCTNRAIEALREASRIHPGAAQPWALLGEIFHHTCRWDNARACFRRALELNPSFKVPLQYEDLLEQVLSAKGHGQGQPSLVERLKGMFTRG